MAMHGSHGEAKTRVCRGCNGQTFGREEKKKKREARYKIGLRTLGERTPTRKSAMYSQ